MCRALSAERVVEVDDALGAVDQGAPHGPPHLVRFNRGVRVLRERVSHLDEGPLREGKSAFGETPVSAFIRSTTAP